MHSALVGCSGFVGSTLQSFRPYSALYNSRNIDEIRGRSFDFLICAAAPATMWAANRDPAADKANLDALFSALSEVKVGRFVLISTIAVLGDVSAGYSEETSDFEHTKPYGRHRWELEQAVTRRFSTVHVIRLPALFGTFIKKNFLFDLINPAPSFLTPRIWDEVLSSVTSAEKRRLRTYYVLDDALGMWQLQRERLRSAEHRSEIESLFARLNRSARFFTNSSSCFQFYNMARLADDIDQTIRAGVKLLHLCPEPLEASVVCRALTGEDFSNSLPPIHKEDVRSVHGSVFGGSGPYIFGRDKVLAELKDFFDKARR